AAHRVLSYLYPAQQTLFDADLAADLDTVADGPAENSGITLGQNVADAIITLRAHDGWDEFVEPLVGSAAGQWRPTPPMFEPALLPQWAQVVPFALTSPDQFRPAGPPSLQSQQYVD